MKKYVRMIYQMIFSVTIKIDLIKHSYGNDIAELLIFQPIRNESHLLITTFDDILSVLQQESDDIKQIEKLMLFSSRWEQIWNKMRNQTYA